MKKVVHPFNLIVGIFASLLFFQIPLIHFDCKIPLALLYGPLFFMGYLYLGQKSVSIKGNLWQFIPFIFLTFLFLILKQKQISLYTQFFFILHIISLGGYSFYILYQRQQGHVLGDQGKFVLLDGLSLFGLSSGVFLLLEFIGRLFHIEIGHFVELVFLCIVIITFIFSIGYLLLDYIGIQHVQPSTLISYFSEKQLLACRLQLENLMNQEKLFLDVNLNLEVITQHTGFEEEMIKAVLRDNLKVSLDYWLAKYRIEHAVSLMQTHPEQLKLSFLANFCGFQSRTVFYRYFKQFVGYSPAEFKNRIHAYDAD